jgi:hypothetical protein
MDLKTMDPKAMNPEAMNPEVVDFESLVGVSHLDAITQYQEVYPCSISMFPIV